MNRSIDGDTVAVQLLPRDQWKKSASVAVEEIDDEEEEKLYGEQEMGEATEPEGEGEPTAKVVGIIRKRWRPYVIVIEKKRNILKAVLQILWHDRSQISPFQAWLERSRKCFLPCCGSPYSRHQDKNFAGTQSTRQAYYCLDRQLACQLTVSVMVFDFLGVLMHRIERPWVTL